jgi:pimeloyl-ACP methyl ester carboxylesterase
LEPAVSNGAPPPTLAGCAAVELLDYDCVPGTATGPGRPGSMLLLHGFGDDKTQLRVLGEALCPLGALALYPSLRAHGDSPSPGWGYSPLDFVADLHRVVDVLPSPFHVVGYSYGALLGVLAAVVLGPDRVRSVVVLDQAFASWPDRYRADEWAEARFLNWAYDYRHCFDVLRALRIPVLTVIARHSHVVPEAEREWLLARSGDGFRSHIVDTDHRGLVRDWPGLRPLVEDFYTSHLPPYPKQSTFEGQSV